MASERLLVDAVRALEETTTDDHTADDAGRRELPDEAAALTVRARAHRQAHLLREALGNRLIGEVPPNANRADYDPASAGLDAIRARFELG